MSDRQHASSSRVMNVGWSNKTLKFRNEIETLLCAAFGTGSYQHGSEPRALCGRSDNMLEKRQSCTELICRKEQGGSNMTGKNCDFFTHKSVPVIFEPPCNCLNV
jgi:hypothetical protein